MLKIVASFPFVTKSIPAPCHITFVLKLRGTKRAQEFGVSALGVGSSNKGTYHFTKRQAEKNNVGEGKLCHEKLK